MYYTASSTISEFVKHKNKQSVSADQQCDVIFLKPSDQTVLHRVFWYHQFPCGYPSNDLRMSALFSAEDLYMSHSDCADIGRYQVQRY